VFVVIAFAACLKEEIDMDNLDTEVAVPRSITLPLVYGSLYFDDFTTQQYDSLIVSQGDTIWLYVVNDFNVSDTLEIGDLGENMDFEYLDLHHGFANSLPIGMRMHIILYDSIHASILDTIYLADHPDSLFIEPAEVNSEGLVIEDQVVEQIGVVSLDDQQLDLLENEATHLIFNAVVPRTGNLVKILEYYSLDFRIGMAGGGIYRTDLDSLNI
jgi:hypothetical protein